MLPFAYYLLKVLLVSGLLYVYYFIALRNKKFHQYNRFYLLFIVALSLIIPLLKIRFWRETAQQELPAIKLLKAVAMRDAVVENSLKSAFTNWSIHSTAFVIFSLVSAAFFIWLITGIVRIFILIKANPNKSWNNVNFIFTEAKGTPFSFFRYIFWNKNIDLQTKEGKYILQHELTHVHEKHSADKLFLHLTLVISWLNPFFWLIRKELNMIHEFIADEKAVSTGDVNSFSAMLLKTAYPQHSFMLANTFFYSPIKRRLIMFTNSKRPSYSYLRRLFILPLLSFVIVFFVFKSKGQNLKPNNNANKESVAKPEKVVNTNEIGKDNVTSDKETDTNIKSGSSSPYSAKAIIDTAANSKSDDDNINVKLIAAYVAQMNLKNLYKKDTALNQKAITDFLLKRLAAEKHLEKKSNTNPEIVKFLESVIAKRIIEKHKEVKANTGIQEVLKDLVENRVKENQQDAVKPKFQKAFTKEKNRSYFSDTIKAKFPGGNEAWKKFLETNLDANVPAKAGAPAGDYTTKLEFVVTETGEIKDLSATKIPARCPGCAVEAVRIIKNGLKWDPMTIGGKNVTSKQVQFISFRVQEN